MIQIPEKVKWKICGKKFNTYEYRMDIDNNIIHFYRNIYISPTTGETVVYKSEIVINSELRIIFHNSKKTRNQALVMAINAWNYGQRGAIEYE